MTHVEPKSSAAYQRQSESDPSCPRCVADTRSVEWHRSAADGPLCEVCEDEACCSGCLFPIDGDRYDICWFCQADPYGSLLGSVFDAALGASDDKQPSPVVTVEAGIGYTFGFRYEAWLTDDPEAGFQGFGSTELAALEEAWATINEEAAP